MKAAIVSLLLGAASVAAKGIRIGGGSVHGVSDNWDAPPLVKATMAFYIIFCLIMILQLMYLIKNLKLIPTMQARAPYIMLTVLTVLMVLAYIGATALERVLLDADSKVLDGLAGWSGLFFDFDYAFRPAVLFYIAHQRAKLLRISRGKGFTPLAGKFWKRCLDWALSAFICLFLITNLGISQDEDRRIREDESFSLATYYTYYNVRSGFGHAITGLVCLLTISVGVALINLFVLRKRWQFNDPIITRLLVAAFPFLVMFALEWLIIEIFVYVAQTKINIDGDALSFSEAFIDGICRVGMGAAVISTMSIPNVQWTAVGPPGQYPSSPNYPPSYHTGAHQQQGWHSATPPWNAQQQPQQPPAPGQPQQPPYTAQMGVAQV